MLRGFFGVFVLVFSDWLSKHAVRSFLAAGESRPIFPPFFYLSHHENPGAAFSFLADRSYGIYLLSALSAAAVPLLLFFILRWAKTRLERIALFLIFAGNLGNLADRLFRGKVTDFLDFRFGNYIYPTFNLADSYLVIAAFLLFLAVFGKERNEKSSFRVSKGRVVKTADAEKDKNER